LRDHYAALRSETKPRLLQTRAILVPVLVDATHKVRDDVFPAAAQISSRLTTEAVNRSAPVRWEARNRAAAALAGARGQVSAQQIAKLQRANSRRKLWFVLCATVTGAATGVAFVLWQRSQHQDWVEDDAVQTTLEGEHDPDAPMRGLSSVSDDEKKSDGGVSSGKRPTDHRTRH
jgi:hypothetical protein